MHCVPQRIKSMFLGRHRYGRPHNFLNDAEDPDPDDDDPLSSFFLRLFFRIFFFASFLITSFLITSFFRMMRMMMMILYPPFFPSCLFFSFKIVRNHPKSSEIV